MIALTDQPIDASTVLAQVASNDAGAVVLFVGTTREFTAGRDGALYLGVNEGNLNDNSGAFDVKVEILPDI